MDKDDLFLHECEEHDQNQSHPRCHPKRLSKFYPYDVFHGSAGFVARKFPSGRNIQVHTKLNAEAEPRRLRCLWRLLRCPFLHRLKHATHVLDVRFCEQCAANELLRRLPFLRHAKWDARAGWPFLQQCVFVRANAFHLQNG
ncbi:hypothetical protein D3C87_1394270 [compost metagenome]